MDSSPSKRRRTSPSTSIAVTAENTFLAQLPQYGVSPSKRRSSLMSPTKASLARFYPSLLPRAKSAEPPRPVGTEKHTSVEQRPVRGSGANGTVPRAVGTASERLETGANGVEKAQELLASARRRSRTPGEGNMLAKQDWSIMSSGIRASPPEEVRDESTVFSNTNGGQQEPVAEAVDMGRAGLTIIPDSQTPQVPSTSSQHAPHLPTSRMGIGEDGEPSLPSTPSQLGLEPPEKRFKGPFLSSPSKRPRRQRKSTANTSPLKALTDPPERSNERQKSLGASLGPRRYIANTPKPPPLPEEAHLLQLRSRLSDLEKQFQDIEDKLLRQLLVSSWQQDRSKDGNDIAKRRKDVGQRIIKIAQLREEVLQTQAAQSIDQGQPGLEAIDGKVASTTASTLTLTQRLANYLPFAIRPPQPAPRPPSPQNNDVNQLLDLDEPQTTAEPFTITTSNPSLLPSTSNETLLQRQQVNLSTVHGLLTCDLHLTANTATQQISHLDIQALTPWAEPELGSWLRRPRHEELEPGAMGRVFGRYWEVAQLRSKCWSGCTQDFKDLIVANAPSSSSSSEHPDKDPLSYHLGTQDLVLALSNVQLRIHWAITLTEQGEAESQSSAHATFPPAFYHRRQQQQQRRHEEYEEEEEEEEGEGEGADSELSRIGDAFAMLVEDRGISEAVGVVCRIVFPT